MDLLSLCDQIGRRAHEAASRGEATFGVPEMSPTVAWVAAMAADVRTREDADAWLTAGAGYHALVRLCARAVTALDALWNGFPGKYRDKVQAELEPMLALWPDVLVLPTPTPLTPLELIDLRAFPVHPLGLIDRPTWTDGSLGSPSEFFFHDLDHARFKVREDLLIEGGDVPDAYCNGTTLDFETGRHRTIMATARGKIGDRLWARVPSRAALVRRLRAASRASGDDNVCRAGELLLFELVHEKGLPLDNVVLNRELARDVHLAKLRAKAAVDFFRGGTGDAVIAALPAAQMLLRKVVL